jgi:hypothetical protein
MNKPFRWLVVVLVLLFAFGCGSDGGDGETSSDQGLISDGRQVVRDIVAGKFSELSERFDEGLKAALSADQLEKGWKDFVELKGAFRSQGEAAVSREGATVVDIELEMANEPGLLRVAFGEGGKISGIYVLDEDIPIS